MALGICAQLRICLHWRPLGEIVTFGIFVGLSLLLQVASAARSRPESRIALGGDGRASLW